jgi:hypothetical protein
MSTSASAASQSSRSPTRSSGRSAPRSIPPNWSRVTRSALDVETVGVGHEPVGVGDADDAHSRLGEIPGACAAHRPESLDHGCGVAGVTVRRRARAAIAEVATPSPPTSSSWATPSTIAEKAFVGAGLDGDSGVVDEFVDGGQSRAEFAAGEDLVDVVLAERRGLRRGPNRRA